MMDRLEAQAQLDLIEGLTVAGGRMYRDEDYRQALGELREKARGPLLAARAEPATRSQLQSMGIMVVEE